MRTQLYFTSNVVYAGWYLAAQNGYFKQAGIDSQLIAGGPNLTSVPAVILGGQAEIGVATLQAISQAVSKGGDLVAFAAQFQESPGGLLSSAKKPIREPKDIVGKTLALDPSAKTVVDSILDKNGLPKDYKAITGTGDVSQLISGACDGMAGLVTSQGITLKLRRFDGVATTFSALGYPSYGNVLFTTRRLLDAHEDRIVAYLKALRKGWDDQIKNPDAGAELTVKLYGKANGLQLEQQKLEARADIPLEQSATTRKYGIGAISMEDLEQQYKVLRDSKVPGLAPLEKVATTSVTLKAA
ncbi:ABC transporter substrate-binding protein [Actinomadura madurae]|uniref:ABC transporter substrate-binding protein n=1 Tax=Actinomadura madurae TaxID=1993 RepID=UPI00399C1162